jgi:hypothetical protein
VDLLQRHVGGQDRVEAAQEPVRRDARREREAGHLGVGVDAGVGAARAAHEDLLAQELADRVL